MAADPGIAVDIAVVALMTVLSRVAGPLAMQGIGLSKRGERVLDALALSVIAAIVASALAQAGLREAVAVAAAASVMLWTGSAARAMLAGMLVAVALSWWMA